MTGSALAPAPARPLWVVRLWGRMREIYGHRWTGQFGKAPTRGLSPAMATWARGLSGVTARELALGLDRLARDGGPWPPALPEFRRLCAPHPEDFRLPPEVVALEEALARHRPNARADTGGDWSHPAVAAAARAAFGRPWGSLRERDAGFLRAYRHAARHVMAGRAAVAPKPEALGPLPEPRACPTEARRHLAALRRIAGAPDRAAP